MSKMSKVRNIVQSVTVFASIIQYTSCHASCNCEDWMNKGGYCVDYIKTKIPSFQIPQNSDEIATLKNRDNYKITAGDVALFNISNYWHVAYVEKVHLDRHGTATAIDVSEMNFGDPLAFDEFRNKWKQESKSEWNRAVCCGVTENYGLTGERKNVALTTVKQVWSPVLANSENTAVERTVDKLRESFSRFMKFTWGAI
ncbi:MAG: hypothetical protein WCK54_21200 [Desulfuromonadales bacterium]